MSGYLTGGILLLVWGFALVINIDNVLRMVVADRIGRIHPVITFIGIIIGIPVFGIAGLVTGPLLISYFILLVQAFEMKYPNSRQTKQVT
jgi:predicted PurR-regulated permease PerM